MHIIAEGYAAICCLGGTSERYSPLFSLTPMNYAHAAYAHFDVLYLNASECLSGRT